MRPSGGNHLFDAFNSLLESYGAKRNAENRQRNLKTLRRGLGAVLLLDQGRNFGFHFGDFRKIDT